MSRFAVAVIPVAFLAFAVACGGDDDNTNLPQCSDGIDNDSDGFTDGADPACQAGSANESDDPTAQCSDGVDNDNDGATDFPDDPGCDDADDNDEFGSGTPDCNDGRDNDGDGKIDYPNDPGCFTPLQDDETDDCPDGPNCPECGDGDDNDFDGMTDFAGGDNNCTSASDDTELDVAPNACGNGTAVTPLPPSGMVTGTLSAGVSNLMPVRCSGAVGTGPEAAYVFTVAERETIVATTDDAGTTIDTVLYVRRACTNSTTELACANDVSATNTSSTLTVDLEPGTYFLIVDARGPGLSGAYVLNVTRFNALGEACTGEEDCAPDHFCRIAAGATTTTCELAVCGDGRDDDGDSLMDYPNDPGCTSLADDTEEDACPGPDCPACANGDDDDGDGQTDYPDDTNCASASSISEFDCTGGDPVRIFASNVTGQSTSGLGNDYDLTCGTDGRDEVWLMQINADLAELRIDTVGSSMDTAIALRRGSCNGFDLQCDDDGAGAGDSSLFLVDVFAGEYYLIVDDKNSSGTYNLNVRGVYLDGAPCDPNSTAFRCGAGSVCEGPVGAAVCEPAACNDTIDEDGDGLPGFPSDPGCDSTTDNDEADDCPNGSNCPACANDEDDDGDTFVDFGEDPGCAAASQDSEEAPCASVDPVFTFTENLTNVGGIGSALNDTAIQCGTNGRDHIYRLSIPTPLTNLRIDTVGSPLDTVVGIRAGVCTGTTNLACDDNSAGSGDSLINLTNVALGEYFIIVEDRFVSNPGTYNLNVRGTLAAGADCDPGSQLYFCPAAHACIGPSGQETCEPAACNDTIDQDGDGFTGFPTDPGCVDTSDPDESDDCPTGPNCPACGNQTNDDGDPWTDYPTDPGCITANDSSELQCTSVDPVIPAVNVTGATTMGKTNDVDLSCGADGRDEVYRFIVDRPLSQLRVDTIGSALDTVVGIRRSTCNGSTDLVCDDDGAGNLDSLAIINGPQFGEYYIIVDDRNGSNSTYNLNIRAILPTGASCVPGNATFVCAEGFVCDGAPGAEVCSPGPCADNVDQDGDGHVGYPTDPGCTSPIDITEEDNCPSGTGCPICSDGIDNDMDSFQDYPADPTCLSASDNVEGATCSSADPILNYTGPVSGSTLNQDLDDVDLSCTTNTTGRDDIYRLVLTESLLRLRIDTIGSGLDTVLAIRRTTCNGSTDLACDDNSAGNGDSQIILNNVAQGEYWIIVDDKNTTTGSTYELNVVAELPVGRRCTPGATTFVCGIGSTCSGTPGAEVCTPGVCNDTVDEDGDGHAAFPNDPGCSDPADMSEADDCPSGPNCPDCGNGLDDDGDGFFDYPADTGCSSASEDNELDCAPENDPLFILDQPMLTGTTTGLSNDFLPSCRASFSVAPDRAYIMKVPVPLTSLIFDTDGSTYDTTIMWKTAACEAADLACDDDGSAGSLDSRLELSNVAPGFYALIMDGASGGSAGNYILATQGTAAAGAACTDPLFSTGVLRCPSACVGGVCQ